MSADPESLRELTRALFGRSSNPENDPAVPASDDHLAEADSADAESTDMREYTRTLFARALSE